MCGREHETHLSEVGDEDNKLARAPASFNNTFGDHERADQQTDGNDEVLDEIEQVQRHCIVRSQKNYAEQEMGGTHK